MDGSLVTISIIDLLMSLISESSPKIFGILRVSVVCDVTCRNRYEGSISVCNRQKPIKRNTKKRKKNTKKNTIKSLNKEGFARARAKESSQSTSPRIHSVIDSSIDTNR